MYGKQTITRKCSVDGCDRPHKAKGLCSGHWERKKRGAPLDDKPLRIFDGEHRKHRPCSVDGCDKEHYAEGYCRMHRQRLHKFGTTDLPDHEHHKCGISDCGRLARARLKGGVNVCSVHADMSAKERKAGRPCPDACELCGERESRLDAWGKPIRLAWDHCHTSGKFRGWLCARCNLVLGRSNDDPALLRKMADYLEAHS